MIRGCFNNGTCVGPNKCECAEGWMGYDCSVPICNQTCLHNGNCTHPNTCTCEKGWMGHDCSVPSKCTHSSNTFEKRNGSNSFAFKQFVPKIVIILVYALHLIHANANSGQINGETIALRVVSHYFKNQMGTRK